MKILNNLIDRLGRKDYEIDKSIEKYDLFIFLLNKLRSLFRGFILKVSLKKSKGLIFVGKRCKISYRNKISFGRTTIIGDNVVINALSKNGIITGDNLSIASNTIIECTGVLRNLGDGLIIGNNVGIAQNCFIQVRGKIQIGNNVIFGPNVSIFSENHNFSELDIPINLQGESRKGIKINDGVWIGTRAIILDGVSLGENSIIAAGSVINKDVPPFSIVGGVPAKVLKFRK